MNNDELKALMAEHNALGAAFITAWNPFSQNLHAKETKPARTSSKPTSKSVD